jgi:hypothetical protein
MAVGAYIPMAGGGSAAKKAQGPPINAQSPDEESFIKYVAPLQCHHQSAEWSLLVDGWLILFRDFLKNAEGDAKKNEKAAH